MGKFSFLASVLVTFLLQGHVFSQDCWRNTTCSGPETAAFPGVWDESIYAPSSRTVSPKSVVSLATKAITSSYTASQTLSGNGSTLVLDFGKEVGGLVTLSYSSTGTGTVSNYFMTPSYERLLTGIQH